MTFEELTENISLQGDIEIVIYNSSGELLKLEKVTDTDHLFSWDVAGGEYESLPVNYIFPRADDDGKAWLVIELEKED